MKEVFKPIPEYPHYEVSNLGNVMSLPRVIKRSNGRNQTFKKRLLKLTLNQNNYFCVQLVKDKKFKTFRVHQLVAMAFLGHTPNGYKITVDHIDNDSMNNRVDNLQLVTNRENCSKDMWRLNPYSKLVGVSKDSKAENRWVAKIYIKGSNLYLGSYITEEKARSVYLKALNNIHLYNGNNIEFKKAVGIKHSVKSSKYKGVSYHKASKKWTASVKVNKRQIHIGSFDCELHASMAYNEFKKIYNQENVMKKQ